MKHQENRSTEAANVPGSFRLAGVSTVDAAGENATLCHK